MQTIIGGCKGRWATCFCFKKKGDVSVLGHKKELKLVEEKISPYFSAMTLVVLGSSI